MFISPSSPSLSSTVSASGTTSGSIRPTRLLSDLLPLSTLSNLPLDRSSALPNIFLLSGYRSHLPSERSSAMLPVREVAHLGLLDATDTLHKSNISIFPANAPSTGTSSSPSVFGSNSYLSASLTSRWTTSSTTLIPSLVTSLSFPLTTDSPSMSKPTSHSLVPTGLTAQSQSSTVPMSSYSLPYSASLPSSIISTIPSVSTSVVTQGLSVAQNLTTTLFSSTTVVTSISLPPSLPPTSTYTITSLYPGQGGATTDLVTSSSVLSTQSTGSAVDSAVRLSAGATAAIALGIVGALAFAALWLFCARRSRNKLVRGAAVIPPKNHSSGPLDEEVIDGSEPGPDVGSTRGIGSMANLAEPIMEERYAAILAALHSAEGFGRGGEGGSTGGIYGSHHEPPSDIDGDDNGTRVSSPTLAVHANSTDDPPYLALSPPPPMVTLLYHQQPQPTPPPSAYYLASRNGSSPGPDAAPWLGGYSAAPSCNSHYTRSQTLGSGSRSGSVDALTRTRTGSEEPLLGIGKATSEVYGCGSAPGSNPASVTEPGGNRLGLGSAFGSTPSSTYSPSGMYSAFYHDNSGSYGTRSPTGSGSHGYASSGSPSSFDALRRVSSQGALSTVHSHTHSQGFKLGFNRGGSLSGESTGKKIVGNRHSFAVPPTSFRAWKHRGLAGSDKEKPGEKHDLDMREKDLRQKQKSMGSASTSESMEERQGRGSPVGGVLGLLERLRRAGHTSSPRSSTEDLPSPARGSVDIDPESGAVGRRTPPPIQVQFATPHRPRRFSFVLSNPDPHPPSLCSGAEELAAGSDGSLHPAQQDILTENSPDRIPGPSPPRGLHPGTPLAARHAPSPVPTEESRLAEGLLHPRLRIQGCSDGSLRDFEDYSRPIAGVVKNRLYSTTTFGTQESETRTPPMQDVDEHEHEDDAVDVFAASMFRDVPRDSWFFEDFTPSATALYSPVRN